MSRKGRAHRPTQLTCRPAPLASVRSNPRTIHVFGALHEAGEVGYPAGLIPTRILCGGLTRLRLARDAPSRPAGRAGAPSKARPGQAGCAAAGPRRDGNGVRVGLRLLPLLEAPVRAWRDASGGIPHRRAPPGPRQPLAREPFVPRAPATDHSRPRSRPAARSVELPSRKRKGQFPFAATLLTKRHPSHGFTVAANEPTGTSACGARISSRRPTRPRVDV
jgi:hypothetical protein